MLYESVAKAGVSHLIPFQLHRRIPFVRRPFFQRDQAIAERDRLLRELSQARREIDRQNDEIARLKASEPVETNAKANVHTYMGYDIPIDLMLMTGGGPDTFGPISRLHIDNLTRYVGLDPGFTVLEIGCGIGRDAIPLTKVLSADRGGHYIGIDIIRPSIEWCVANIQARNPNFVFYNMNIQDQLHNPAGAVAAAATYLPVPDARVDRVIMQSVFTHMLRADVAHYLGEIRRVMKPGALAYLTVFLFHDALLARAQETNLTVFNLRFEHEVEPGCRINDLAHPTGAVAYTNDLMDKLIAEAGLRHARPPLLGSWSGYYPEPQDGQDVLILERT